MSAVLAWLRLDLRRRFSSLLVLTLLIAVAGATVLTAVAGARRGATSEQRLLARTLPTDAVVLPNQPGFDWRPFEKLPYVEAISEFAVSYGMQVKGADDALDFPRVNDTMYRTIEKPIVYSGRVPNPKNPDEIVSTLQFAQKHHYRLGETLTAKLPDGAQMDTGNADQLTWAQLRGPVISLHLVGIVRSPWLSDVPGQSGGLAFSNGLVNRYRPELLGATGQTPINAMFRLKDGAADVPRLRADVARLGGRPDIDVWNMRDQYRSLQRNLSFEARCLLAFGLAAFLASVFLVGQAIARAAAGTAVELQTARALGMTPRQTIASATAAPAIAGFLGSVLAVVGAGVASRWFPIGSAKGWEPSPGTSWDWAILLPAAALIVFLVVLAAALSSVSAARANGTDIATRRSGIASGVARAGLAIPIVIGTRFALEPGRGKSAVPVRPAIAGAIAGVLGVIAVFSFSGGVNDAIGHPERFGQTYQAMAFAGFSDHPVAPAAKVTAALRGSDLVTGVDDARLAVATSKGDGDSVALWAYGSGVKPLPTVVLSGRMPQAADEVLLAPGKLKSLHAHVGDTVTLTGSKQKVFLRIVGSGFVPVSPHNGYNDGGWVTDAGYNTLFTGFKFEFVLASLRPDARTAAGLAAINRQVNAALPSLAKQGFQVGTPQQAGLDVSSAIAQLRQVRTLPIALGIFLAGLAIAAVGHALATAVRRRAPDIAVLRALGMTPWQSRWIVVVQATVLMLAGLAFGVLMGLALGRSLWHVVADYTPLQYVPPTAVAALALIAPVALLVGMALSALPARRAARTRVAVVLRAE